MECEFTSVAVAIDIHSHLNELNTPRIRYFIYSNVLHFSIFDTGNVSRETLLISILNWYLLLDIRLFLSTFSKYPFFRLFFGRYIPFFRVFTTYYNSPFSTIPHHTTKQPIIRHFPTFFPSLIRQTLPFFSPPKFDTICLNSTYTLSFSYFRHYSTYTTYLFDIFSLRSTLYHLLLHYTTLHYIYIHINTNTTNIY